MNILLEHVDLPPDCILAARDTRNSVVRHPFHLHEELEIACVVGAEGNVYCGTAVEPFASGQVFVIGERVPHQFVPARPGTVAARVIVLQLRSRALGEQFWNLAELAPLRRFIERTEQGITFGERGGVLVDQLGRIASARGAARVGSLLEFLEHLARRPDAISLAVRPLRVEPGRAREFDRIQRLQQWLQTHFTDHHEQDAVASELGLSRTSFCRWVRSVTGRTYTEILNDYRVGHARLLLRQSDLPVESVAVECGYRDPSTLYREFRKRCDVTPARFRDRRIHAAGATSTDSIPQ